MKFKIGDRTIAKDRSFIDDIIGISIGFYKVRIVESIIMSDTIGNIVDCNIDSYDIHYDLDKEYIWNNQLKQLLEENV